MTGDNGDKLTPEPQAPIKTTKQLAQERLERYQKNPEKFVEFSEIVVCVKRSTQGLGVYINGDKHELQIAWAELNESIMGILRAMKLEAAMKQEAAKNMIQKPGAMMNFARKMVGRK